MKTAEADNSAAGAVCSSTKGMIFILLVGEGAGRAAQFLPVKITALWPCIMLTSTTFNNILSL
jgi:hypothetical protein